MRGLLRPGKTPLGRWPAPGERPLVTLQQAAVNATLEIGTSNEILAVNGPPGTGKTTLLRDVIVARIVERAEVMAGFDIGGDAVDMGMFGVNRHDRPVEA